MDLPLLPSAVSQYKQRAGARFTVRSANSPVYCLNRRAGFRKREAAAETRERLKYGTSAITNLRNTEDTISVVGTGSHRNNQCEETEPSSNKMTVRLMQNITTDQTVPESGSHPGENLPVGIRGRTEWKRISFANRSKSVDWRREESPDRSSNAGMSALSLRRENVCRRASSAMERRNGVEVEERRTGGAAHVSPALPKCGSNSLPSRWRSLTGPANKFPERDPSLGLKGGQSIVERIEKLFSSAGLGKAEEDNSLSSTSVDSRQRSYGKMAGGGTFPRRFSADFSSPARGWMPPIWTQNEFNASGSKTLPSPKRSSSHERATGSHWQGQTWTRHTDGGEVTWRKGFVDSGTRSLDRARSRNTTAARIRAARAAAGIPPTQQPNSFSGETSVSSGDPPVRIRERRASAGKIESCTNLGEERRDTSGINNVLKERTGRVREERKDRVEDTKQKPDLKSSTLDEVFETTQKITSKAAERKKLSEKLSAASSASVKNKIDQFEALTQNVQGSERSLSMPRRTYSVPTLNRLHDGVKKSRSAKDIDILRNRSEGLKEGWDVAGQSMRNATKLASGRSLSVDEVGLKLEKKESGESDVAKEVENNVFDHYSKLRNTLKIPLNEGAQRKRRKCAVDEPDFFQVSSPEEENKTNGTVGDCEGQKMRISSGPTSPFSDNDKTPTNTPDHSPSPAETQQEATPTADAQNKNTFVFNNGEDPSDTSPLAGPFTTSSPVSLPGSSALDVSLPGSSALDVSLPGSSALDVSLPGSSALDVSLPGSSALDVSLPGSSTLDVSLPGSSALDVSLPGSSALDVSLPGSSALDVSLPGSSTLDVSRADPKGRKQLLDLDAWITGLNPEFKGWNYEDEDSEDDDDSTEKDDDSIYDSDSGESSITITSSNSDRKSFSVNLADLCNFTGTEYESDDDSDEWPSSSRRTASLSSDMSALSYVSVMPAEELERLLEDVRSLGNNTLQDYNEVQVVVLHKDVGVGLGFSLAGGVDQSKPITVHKVFHSGVAAKEGSIRAGDRVLSINGTALQGMAHWEALRVLRRAKTREMGVVVLKGDEASGPPQRGVQEKSQDPPSTQCDSGQRVCVQLQKNSRDLGFSLEGGVDSSEGNRPLTVQKVFLGGPVDKVHCGDELLEIQGRSVVGMRRLEAWTLIRTLPSGPVDVVLCRHLET